MTPPKKLATPSHLGRVIRGSKPSGNTVIGKAKRLTRKVPGLSEPSTAFKSETPSAPPATSKSAAPHANQQFTDAFLTNFKGESFTDPALVVALNNEDPLRQSILQAGLALPPAPLPPTIPEADAAILRRNLRRRMKALGLSARKLSMDASLNSEAVRQMLIGRAASPRPDSLRKIAGVLMCTMADLTGDAWWDALNMDAARKGGLRILLAQRFMQAEDLRNKAADTTNPVTRKQYLEAADALDFESGPYEWNNTQAFHQQFIAAKEMMNTMEGAPPQTPTPVATTLPAALMTRKDLPIYASAQGGSNGTMILDFTPIDHVARPSTLSNATDAFGFYVVEESMSPVYEHGDMVIVKPGLPPRAGANAVFIKEAEDGSTYALVKRLESWTAQAWNVTQFYPKRKTFTLDRKEWSKCLIIVVKHERG